MGKRQTDSDSGSQLTQAAVRRSNQSYCMRLSTGERQIINALRPCNAERVQDKRISQSDL